VDTLIASKVNFAWTAQNKLNVSRQSVTAPDICDAALILDVLPVCGEDPPLSVYPSRLMRSQIIVERMMIRVIQCLEGALCYSSEVPQGACKVMLHVMERVTHRSLGVGSSGEALWMRSVLEPHESTGLITRLAWFAVY
jgi:hypothetical protein